jgi:hypothetical protein
MRLGRQSIRYRERTGRPSGGSIVVATGSPVEIHVAGAATSKDVYEVQLLGKLQTI